MIDNEGTLRQFTSSDNKNFSVERELNLSHKASLISKLKQLMTSDWRHIVISRRCITLPDNSTYGLESELDIFLDSDQNEQAWSFKATSTNNTSQETI